MRRGRWVREISSFRGDTVAIQGVAVLVADDLRDGRFNGLGIFCCRDFPCPGFRNGSREQFLEDQVQSTFCGAM